MSRPSSSVPSTKRRSPPGIQAGGTLLSITLPARGGWGASRGAATPATTTIVSTASANRTTRRARRLIQTRDWRRAGRGWATCGSDVTPTASAADAWVEVAIQQVDEQIDRDE